MKTSRKNSRSILLLFARTVWHWDLWLAIFAGLLFWGVYVFRPFSLQPSFPIAGIGIAGGLAAFAVTNQLKKGVVDRHRDSKLGELTRRVDPDSRALTLPHVIVGSAALLASVLSLLLVVLGPLPGHVLALLYSADLILGTYVFGGILSLWRLDRRDEAREARLRALREADARSQRSRDKGSTARDDEQ